MKSAIIVAAAAEERRAIAQFLKPTGLFGQVHFCGATSEVEFLLANSSVDIIFCDIDAQRRKLLKISTALVDIAASNDLQLVFCSHLDPTELTQAEIIPSGAHCLSYESSPTTATALLNHLLRGSGTIRQTNLKASHSKLLDNDSGIYNRFYFDTFLDQELSRFKLTGRPFSLLLIEPEKERQQFSDSHWLTSLPSVTLTIKEQIRTSDLLCRIEKKRLALLLPETSSFNAERVVNRIQSKIVELANDIPIALKFGLASPNRDADFNRHGLLSQAEAAM